MRLYACDFHAEQWVFVQDFSPSGFYQCSVMDLIGFQLTYGNDDHQRFLFVHANGDVFVRWRLDLTNGDDTIIYGTDENQLLVWFDPNVIASTSPRRQQSALHSAIANRSSNSHICARLAFFGSSPRNPSR